MKAIIFLCTILLLMSFDTDSSNSQNDFYFAKFGFDYQLIADPKIELLSLFNAGPQKDKLIHTDGFNHYEIHFDSKQLVHRYVGNNSGEKEITKIDKIVRTGTYIKFETKSADFGHMVFYVNLLEHKAFDIMVKYQNGKNLELAFI